MIGMTLDVKVSPNKQEEFLQAMHSLLGDPERRDRPKASTLFRKADDETGFSLMFEWETQEDLEGYLRAEEFGVLLGAVKVLCEESAIRYTRASDEWTDFPRVAKEP